MKRTSYNIRRSVGDVVSVSGYTFNALGMRIGVSNDNMVNADQPGRRFDFWIVSELTSGAMIGSVSAVKDLPGWLVSFADSGRVKSARTAAAAYADCNPGLVPALDLLFAHNFKGATA